MIFYHFSKETVMNKTVRRGRLLTLIITVGMLVMMTTQNVNAAYTPPVRTLRLGLFYNTTVIPSANLQNANGFGSGFEFGYYNSDRDFMPIGALTYETAISMVIDRNMVWYPGTGNTAGEYREGTEGSVRLSCFHIQKDGYYETYEQAKSAAEAYKNSFVKYESGQFRVMAGQYETRAAAESAIETHELAGCSVSAGTTNTITVVVTGTSKILFEFDHGGTRYLAVRPMATGGEKPETWFRGYRYRGGFEYARRTGELITVVNCVDIDEYIKGILPYEMNNAWPIEALKAQACCSRSYALANLNKHGAHGFDLCTTEDCQVYRGTTAANERTDRAVIETAGMFVTYNGALCTTYYASTNGGASENMENVWGSTVPYLRGVIDPYEADIAPTLSNYYWTITYTPEELTQRLRSRGYNCSTIVSLKVSEYTPTGNVLSITLTDINGSKFTVSKREPIREALGVPTQRFRVGVSEYGSNNIYANEPAVGIDANSGVYVIDSSGTAVAVSDGRMYAITSSGNVEIVTGENSAASGSGDGKINGVFTIKGAGRGHSLGMSQWGAYSMAEYHGKTYVEIIKFYFTGVEIG